MWKSGLACNSTGDDRFLDLLPNYAVIGSGTCSNLASFLMMGVDAGSYPIDRQTVLKNALRYWPGTASPSKDADRSTSNLGPRSWFLRPGLARQLRLGGWICRIGWTPNRCSG